jgi:glycosyltransferase involved in cell wall biosynthesis
MSLVSVVVPAYNVEQYIEECLNSILAQTYRNFEVLVINDGSTDGTEEKVSAFRDRRIILINQRNRGLAGARNTGARRACGEYVAFLDSDDRWHPDKLKLHVEHLDNNPMVGVSYSQSAFINAQGMPMRYRQRPKLKGISSKDVFLRNPVGNGSAPVLRSKTLQDIAYVPDGDLSLAEYYFDESFRQSEDIECWLRIALTTDWKFEGIGLPLTEYRVNDGGLSAALDKQLASWERVVAKTSIYAGDFVAKNVDAARAYQLRYLARRAVRSNDPIRALSLISRSMISYPGILLEEPGRTLATLLAAILRGVMPEVGYSKLEGLAMHAADSVRRLAAA